MASLVLTLSVVPGLDDLPKEDTVEFLCQHPEVLDVNTSGLLGRELKEVILLAVFTAALVPRALCAVPFHFHSVPGS